MGNTEPCTNNKHRAKTFICEEGCDETLCINCCSRSVNNKRCCKMCKIRTANAAAKKSNIGKSEETKGSNSMLDLPAKGSEESKRG